MTTKEIIEKRRYYKKLKREKNKETIYTILTLILALIGMVTEV